MQIKPVIACVTLLAGSLAAVSGTTAQASPTPHPSVASSAAPGLHVFGEAAPRSVPSAATALYVAPDGTDGAAGTEADPTTLASAVSRVESGGTVYLRGGTYHYARTVTIPPGNDGSSSARTTLAAYPGEKPVLNFAEMSEDPANRGLAVNGDFWHINGITVEHAGDNGIFVGGSNNIVERVVTRFNHDSGLQISRIASTTPDDEWPANNLILSSESHDNADSDGEDADGFASKLTSGPGNVFRYTVSHNNIDDGWDLYTKNETGPIGPVTIEDSLSYSNGTLSDGTVNADAQLLLRQGHVRLPEQHLLPQRRRVERQDGRRRRQLEPVLDRLERLPVLLVRRRPGLVVRCGRPPRRDVRRHRGDAVTDHRTVPPAHGTGGTGAGGRTRGLRRRHVRDSASSTRAGADRP